MVNTRTCARKFERVSVSQQLFGHSVLSMHLLMCSVARLNPRCKPSPIIAHAVPCRCERRFSRSTLPPRWCACDVHGPICARGRIPRAIRNELQASCRGRTSIRNRGRALACSYCFGGAGFSALLSPCGRISPIFLPRAARQR